MLKAEVGGWALIGLLQELIPFAIVAIIVDCESK